MSLVEQRGTATDLVGGWNDYCRRMLALGERLRGNDFPQDPLGHAEGVAHLAQQVACWVAWYTAHADPLRPAFMRQNDLVTKWGGPNVENVYRHACVDPSLRYRITGKMHSCEEFILAMRAGFMHLEKWGTVGQLTASELGISEGDDFEILLGGDGSDPAFTPIHEDAITVSIREYYFDWRPLEPATFTIECLDNDYAPRPIDADRLRRGLDEAADATERSLLYWNEYMRDARAQGTDNVFASPQRIIKGLRDARYSFCFYNLQPGEALLIESEVPDARYWGLQLATLAWFESPDFVHHVTSFNHRQAHVSSDGLVRAVIAHEDPGVLNWLDTEGRQAGLATYRWFWGSEQPEVRTQVVDVAKVAQLMPADTPRVDAELRARQVKARQDHVAWRFRT
jgi:hypothetical protein